MKKRVKILIGLFMTFYMTGSCFAYTDAELSSANYLAKKGIIVDNSLNVENYNLDNDVLRQEIAALSLAVSGSEKEELCKGKFRDVTSKRPNTWACYSIEGLLNNGIIATNEYFRPEDKISKAESIGMIVKAVYGDRYSYDENLDSSWQEQVVAFARAKGLVDNFTNYDEDATRGFVFEAAKKGLVIKEGMGHYSSLTDCLLYGNCANTGSVQEETPLSLMQINNSTNNILVIPSSGALLLDFDIRNNGEEDIYITGIHPELTNTLGFTPDEIGDIKLYMNNEVLTFNTEFDFNDINAKVEAGTVANFMIMLEVLDGAIAGKYFTIALTGDDIDLITITGKEPKFTLDSKIIREFTFFTDTTTNERPTNRDLTYSDTQSIPLIEYENFTPTANDLYRFYIAPEKDIELTSFTLNISGTASFAGTRFIITKNKLDGPIVAMAEVSRDFTNGEVIFSIDGDVEDKQISSNISSTYNKVWAFSKTSYFVQVDYIPSDVLLDNKGETRDINITNVQYVDLVEE